MVTLKNASLLATRPIKLRKAVDVKMAAGSARIPEGATAYAYAAENGIVTVGPTETSKARGSAVLGSNRHRGSEEQVQRVTVLNGDRAAVRLTQSLPLQWLEVASTPHGPAAVLRQGWMEAGSAVELRPKIGQGERRCMPGHKKARSAASNEDAFAHQAVIRFDDCRFGQA